ncbi:hypothetical protein LEP1GSC106_0995 [Leptospira interrogans serovar Grippotyphosa str. UI 12764]|nr:hypothetical protein LEP1GSC106_0995 [Leptospira interrogans serovar Grippotyphosa str. UI 12764]
MKSKFVAIHSYKELVPKTQRNFTRNSLEIFNKIQYSIFL